MCISFIGGSISTVTLGFVSNSHDNLRSALIGIVISGYFLAGVLFGLTIFSYPKDLEKFTSDGKDNNKVHDRLFE